MAETNSSRSRARTAVATLLTTGALLVAAVLIWQILAAAGAPDPLAPGTGRTAAVLDIGVLVFREGLECILVLAAITASMVGETRAHRRPVAAGAGLGFGATLVTWLVAVGIMDSLAENVSALDLQAATGLLAIVVLLVVMNWFFHKAYWTGWIGFHNRRKKEILKTAAGPAGSRRKLLLGLGLLGFTSMYREGFEVVLFLQSYRLKLGGTPVLNGVLVGLLLTTVVGALTFVANRRLPYRKMLVFTGVMLGGVLLVMVGEQVQEMQLAHWLPVTEIPALARVIPGWMELWFAVFPTVETLLAQLGAALLVLGSYFLVQLRLSPLKRGTAAA